MEFINYDKRKNQDLFVNLQEETLTNLTNVQNYIPIYSRFFELNESNYNSINLQHAWCLSSLKHRIDDKKNIYKANLKNSATGKSKAKDIFFKMAPLLDSFKYLIGKYNIEDKKLFSLPKYNSTVTDVHPKLIDTNNSAYVDGFFLFLSSTLIHSHKFIHGVDYYGSFLAIQNSYTVNVAEDLEYLCKSDFFNRNKNKLFLIEDFSASFYEDTNKSQQPLIKIDTTETQTLSIDPINNDLFEDLFTETEPLGECITLEELSELSIEVDSLQQDNIEDNNTRTTTIKSSTNTSSSCSSRSSHTNSDDEMGEEDDEDDDEDGDDDDDEEYSDGSDESESSYNEPVVNATIKQFPVQVIGMEQCETTFDELILSNKDLPEEEWFSAFMQIIMILVTYQKAFWFTHNDLHSCNVMYNTTDKKYLYYCYNKVYYKVPTFGRIFKIIDFGRAIYKCKGQLFCSDSFQQGGDAVTQYNTEPYFNDKKPRLEPNPSFDLCRLACSIFDYVVDDLDDVKNLKNCSEVVKLIVEWCLDDKGLNLLYKTNGDERYPEFKLYKMIARTAHKHTPQAQLSRKVFKQYICQKASANSEELINIDEIPSFIV